MEYFTEEDFDSNGEGLEPEGIENLEGSLEPEEMTENVINENVIAKKERLSELDNWFIWYDIECNKLRRRQEPEALEQLDVQAETNATELKNLRDELEASGELNSL